MAALPSVERIAASRSVYCAVAIKPAYLSAGKLTGTTRHRQHKNAQRGAPLDQCAEPVTHLIDGEHYCRAHAGALALRALEVQP